MRASGQNLVIINKDISRFSVAVAATHVHMPQICPLPAIHSFHLEGFSGYQTQLHEEQIPPELYDLGSDIAESINVADEHPEIVKDLLAEADKASQELGDAMTGAEGT